jgi:hypothetical protein
MMRFSTKIWPTLLSVTPLPFGAPSRWQQTTLAVLSGIFLLIVVAEMTFAFLSAWVHGEISWFSYWEVLSMAVTLFIVIVLRITYVSWPIATMMQCADVAALFPSHTEQPPLLEPNWQSTEAVASFNYLTIAYAAWFQKSPGPFPTMWKVVTVLLLGGYPFVATIQSLNISLIYPNWGLYVAMGNLLLILVIAVMQIVLASSECLIHADTDGIYWRIYGREAEIPWDTVRAFICIEHPARRTRWGMRHKKVTYLLDAQDVRLRWDVSFAPSAPNGDILRADAVCLAQIITSQTGLPLRDGSAFFQEMTRQHWDISRAIAARRATGIDPAMLEAFVASSPQSASIPQLRRHLGFRLGMLAVPVAVVLLLGVMAQMQQEPYYTALPGRIAAETPLYRTTFATPDGAWPVHQPAAGALSAMYYSHGTYLLAGNGGKAPVVALSSKQFGDVAIQVTVHPTFVPPNAYDPDGYYPSFGLILHDNPQNGQMLIFEWSGSSGVFSSCIEFDQCSMQDEKCTFIGTNPVTTAQTMLIVIHGPLYLFFADGSYMGGCYDLTNLGHPTGRIGIFSDSAADVAFTNFAVYPLPMNSFWDWL